MLVEVFEGIGQLSSPLPNASPPEPESFIEAARLHHAVKEELATILASSSFRTSRKSCEFLRHVVQVTLDGRIDSLKERSIGMDLLGRDVSYDPTSDATVRVRANEVRKRLTSFYATRSPVSGYRIELLPGSYTPRFVPTPKQISPLDSLNRDAATAMQEARAREQQFTVAPLNTLKMAGPALIALFLCALFLRQQIQSSDPYHQFWNKRLHGKTVMLFFVDEAQDQKASTGDATQAMLPIVWLAGRYNLKPLAGPQEMKNDDRQDALDGDAAIVHIAEATPPAFATDKRLRYSITSAQGGLHLTNRMNPTDMSTSGEAALLTLLPEHPSTLWLTGTDWKAVNALAETVATRSNFPSQINLEAEAGRVVQATWRSTPSPHLEIYTHQP